MIRFNRSGASTLSKTALALAASAIVAACGGHGSATNSVLPQTTGHTSNALPNTVTNIYGGGSTLASLLYRQWMDYYGVAMPPDPQGAPNGLPVNPKFLYYYAGIGSGGGRAAFLTQTSSTITPTEPPVYCPNDVNTCYPYPLWHYSGSDATLSSAEISCYQVGCPPNVPNPAQPARGQYVQIPTLITDITIFYNPSGQTISHTKGLRLSRNTYCGIWEGAITNWGDPSITSDNGGVQVSTQPIQRVVRADSSGTTFLITNHLNTVCQNLSNPAFDWTGGVGGTVTWPGGTVLSGTGSGGVVSVVGSTPGGIGYVGPSFVAPIAPGGLPTANLQNENAFGQNKLAFRAPNVVNTLNAFKGVQVPSNSDPFDLAILVPDPLDKNAYPIVGFTWLEAYQCYNTHNEALAMKDLILWYAQTGTTGTTPPDVILEEQGLAPLNSAFKKAVRKIAGDIVKGPITNVCTI